MKPNSRINKIRSLALVVVGLAVILFAGGNASAQTGHRAGVWQQPYGSHNWHYAIPVAPYQRLHSPLTYREPHGAADRYKSNYGEYGYSHYGPVPGVYGSHYGYYRRPYVRWSPHYGWTHHASRRH